MGGTGDFNVTVGNTTAESFRSKSLIERHDTILSLIVTKAMEDIKSDL